MFSRLHLLTVLAVASLTVSVTAAFSFVNVSYFPANSHCDASKPSPKPTEIFELNKCYDGYMYDCDYTGTSITYMNFGEVNCAGLYPKTYGLPGEFCMSPVYAYSSLDTFFHCY